VRGRQEAQEGRREAEAGRGGFSTSAGSVMQTRGSTGRFPNIGSPEGVADGKSHPGLRMLARHSVDSGVCATRSARRRRPCTPDGPAESANRLVRRSGTTRAGTPFGGPPKQQDQTTPQ
jgi:hypothetical protein